MRFEFPTPELLDRAAGIRLRPWRSSDAGALAAAWEDEEVARNCGVPVNGSLVQAARWISGCADRADKGLALDLAVVTATGDRVVGEVGIGPFVPPAVSRATTDVIELGWWVSAAERRRGAASAAVGLVAEWASLALAPARLVARIPPGHRASEIVATGAGFTCRGRLDAEHDLWTRPRETVTSGATVRS